MSLGWYIQNNFFLFYLFIFSGTCILFSGTYSISFVLLNLVPFGFPGIAKVVCNKFRRISSLGGPSSSDWAKALQRKEHGKAWLVLCGIGRLIVKNGTNYTRTAQKLSKFP